MFEPGRYEQVAARQRDQRARRRGVLLDEGDGGDVVGELLQLTDDAIHPVDAAAGSVHGDDEVAGVELASFADSAHHEGDGRLP